MMTLPTPETTRIANVAADPIVLADGRAWGFARPSNRLKPTVVTSRDLLGRPKESVAVRVVVEYPLEVRRRVDAMRATLEVGADVDRYEMLFDLAAALLRNAHDIDPATAAALLDLGEDLPRFAAKFVTVARGSPGLASDLSEGGTHV